MKERSVFLCIATLVAAALGFAANGTRMGEFAAVLILATAVFVCAALLARLMYAPRPVPGILSALACAAAVLCSPDTAMPMIAASVLSIACEYLRAPLAVAAASGACALSLLFTGARVTPIMESVLVTAASAYILFILNKMDEARREAYALGDRIEGLRERVGSQDRLAKSMSRISKLEERNRLAARLHDEVGHGVSGSILLLEGADAVMANEPDKARATVRRVTENLRGSMDNIRAVLHEERSGVSEMSLARIGARLSTFEADYPGIRTRLTTEGDMEGVRTDIWTCVMDNMLEAMTNTLRHSDATEFSVSIENSNKLLTVAFLDNGSGAGVPGEEGGGMGLRNMEERCALAYGRCFFRGGTNGFRVVMTFPQRDETA